MSVVEKSNSKITIPSASSNGTTVTNISVSKTKVPLDGLGFLANPKKQTENLSDDEDADVPDINLSGVEEDDDDDDDADDENPFSSMFQNTTNNDDDDDDDDDEDDDDDDEYETPRKPMSYEDIIAEKQDLLYKLDKLERQGYRISRKYTLASNLDDIRYEFNKVKRQRDVEKSIRMYRKVLMGLTSGTEYLNKKFNPLEIKLDGWSESQMENINDYDEVFEELHDKYSDSISMAPELKLMFMVGGSAFMFHLTNTLFKNNAPSLDEVLKKNPDLMRSLSQATLNTMNGNMGGGGGSNPLFNMMSQGIDVASNARMGRRPDPRAESSGSSRMKGPSGVDNILNNLNETTTQNTRRRKKANSGINIDF